MLSLVQSFPQCGDLLHNKKKGATFKNYFDCNLLDTKDEISSRLVSK